MTNAGDFRRFYYSSETDEALRSFSMGRSSAAPKVKEPTEKRKFNTKSNLVYKDEVQLKQEQRKNARNVITTMAVCFIFFAMFAAVISSFSTKYELTRQIYAEKMNIANAQSENISLTNQLDTMVSMSMIDSYAVNKLGMKKMDSSQVMYINVKEFKETQNKSSQTSSAFKTTRQLSKDISNL